MASPSIIDRTTNIHLIYQLPQALTLGQRRAGEGLDIVHQAVRSLRRAVLIGGGDRPRDIGVEARGERQIRRLLVMNVPEAARQALHEDHGAGNELVARRFEAEQIELPVEAHEDRVIVLAPGFLHSSRNRGEGRALGGGGPPRRAACDQPLKLSSKCAGSLISRSSSRRTSRSRSCVRMLTSETMIPRRGMMTMRRSRAKRWIASRLGVRPILSRLLST